MFIMPVLCVCTSDERIVVYLLHAHEYKSEIVTQAEIRILCASHHNYPPFSLGFGISTKLLKILVCTSQSTGKILAHLKKEGDKKLGFECSNF
jgi:hypothetical protein